MRNSLSSCTKLGFLALLMLVIAGCASLNSNQTNYSYSSQPIARNTYEMPPAGNDIIGRIIKVRAEPGDNFDKIAQRYDIGAQELIDANPRYKPYRIPIGAKIVVPLEYILPPVQYRKGIVINVAELRLYYFDSNGTVMTFPVALGRQGWRTPVGKTYVYRKQEAPTWHVPKAIRDAYLAKTGEEHAKTIEPGPENPLGNYAIYLHMKGYLIHGTNNPASIGRLVSSGCIRMFNADVEELYHQVKRGTPVNMIYYPNKAGWRDNKLYLEAHTAVNSEQGLYVASLKSIDGVIQEALDEHAGYSFSSINHKLAQRVLRSHTGVPTVIGG